VRFCPHCGTQVPDDAAFCPSCGKALHSPAGAAAAPYPARLVIDYPDRPLSRLSTLFRPVAAIPIALVFALVAGDSFGTRGAGSTTTLVSTGGGVLVLPVVLMLLFRRKYPGWWFDWNLELTRFSTRLLAYVALLDDRYPSTDETQAVHLEIDRPDGAALSRGLPLVKWLLAIPHLVVLVVVGVGVAVTLVIAWFAILFTARYPRWAFDFVVGWIRWGLRVNCYAFLLTTDRYPPFSLGE